MINNKTRLNLVIGNPLDHSKSPLLHNAVYNHLDCNALMLAHVTEHLSSTVDALKTLSVDLAAVTMPYKESIVSYLDEKSPEVKKLEAANTVINHKGKLTGYNTDVDGIAYAFRHISLANKNVLILGAGGASRAAAYVLNQQNANLLWLNRTPKHVLPLLEMFGGILVDADSINQLPIDVIINTTPLGMFPLVHLSPLPSYDFRKDQVIFDMVYNPMETLLIKMAKQKGAMCISGLEMFIGQGLKQIELWLDRSIVTNEIIELVRAELHSSLNPLSELA